MAMALETIADTNKPLPNELAAAKYNPSLPPSVILSKSLDALNDENTSGAPFPKAKSVTPANDSENLRCFAIFARTGER
jgi:hypothetical protein